MRDPHSHHVAPEPELEPVEAAVMSDDLTIPAC
jgi:hypothetical protein